MSKRRTKGEDSVHGRAVGDNEDASDRKRYIMSKTKAEPNATVRVAPEDRDNGVRHYGLCSAHILVYADVRWDIPAFISVRLGT